MMIDKEIVCVEKKYFPQAVVEYTQFRGKNRAGDVKFRDLTSAVKKHLASVGWIIYYQKRPRGDKRDLLYETPNGKIFYTLLSACLWYVGLGCIQIKGDAKYQGLVLLETKKRKANEISEPTSKRPRQGAVNILSKLIDDKIVLPGDVVHYRNKKGGISMKQGSISPDGIICGCCQKVFPLTKFEAHAGSSNHRPSAHIFLEDGRSISECQNGEKKAKNPVHECLNYSEKRVEKVRPLRECQKRRLESHQGKEADPGSDSICSVCRLEGDLIICDQCPSAFHTECVGLKHVPKGDWFCPSCCCRICNQVAVKPYKEQPMQKNSYLQCGQCEHRYHFKCVRSRRDYEAKEIWFCNSRCESIHLALQNLLGKPVPVVGRDDLEWLLLKYKHNNVADSASYSKLNSAFRIMEECFEPVIEARTGRNIVRDAIFNKCSDLHRLNFPGFYTMGLGTNGKFFTAALIRIYGDKIAEIPFVGTLFKHRKHGLCRILMNELEKKLVELGVERLVLPAAPYVLETWEKKFGFSRMNDSEKLNFLGCTFLDFPGTIMCQKILKNTPSPDCKQDEHIYDHIDKNTMLEVFLEDQENGTSPELQNTDLLSCEDAKLPGIVRPDEFKRRKLRSRVV